MIASSLGPKSHLPVMCKCSYHGDLVSKTIAIAEAAAKKDLVNTVKLGSGTGTGTARMATMSTGGAAKKARISIPAEFVRFHKCFNFIRGRWH